MRKQTLQDKMILHIKSNSTVYIFVVVLLLMGVIFGAVVVNSLHASQKEDLMFYLNQFFGEVSKEKIGDPATIWKESFFSHLTYIGLIWLLGISIIGLPIILVLLFLKGVVVGFTVGFLVDQMGVKGFLLSFVAVLPQNIIVIPVYIAVSAISISFCVQLIRQLFVKKRADSILPQLFRYSLAFIVVGIFLIVASFIEGYASPYLMKMVMDVVK